MPDRHPTPDHYVELYLAFTHFNYALFEGEVAALPYHDESPRVAGAGTSKGRHGRVAGR